MHTFVTVLLSAASIWQVCDGNIEFCTQEMMTANGATIYSTVGGRVTIAFQVVADKDLFRYLRIEHPNLCDSVRNWYSGETNKVHVAMTTVEIPKSKKYRTVIEVTVKHLEHKDFTPNVPFQIYVHTVTSERAPNITDSVLFTFTLLERVECSGSEKRDNGTCDRGWMLIQGQCVRVFGKSTWANAYKECEQHGGEIVGDLDIIKSCVGGSIPASLKAVWVNKRTLNECYLQDTEGKKNREQLGNCSLPQFFLCGKEVKGPVQLCPNQGKLQTLPAALGKTVNFSVCLVSFSSPYVIQIFRNSGNKSNEGFTMDTEVQRIRSCPTHYILTIKIVNVQTRDYGQISIRIRNGYGDLIYNLVLKPPDKVSKPVYQPYVQQTTDGQSLNSPEDTEEFGQGAFFIASGDEDFDASGDGDDVQLPAEGKILHPSTQKEGIQSSTDKIQSHTLEEGVQSSTEKIQAQTQKEGIQSSTEKIQAQTQKEGIQSSTEKIQSHTQKEGIQLSTQEKDRPIQKSTQRTYIQSAIEGEIVLTSTQREDIQPSTQREDIQPSTQREDIQPSTQREDIQSSTQREGGQDRIGVVARKKGYVNRSDFDNFLIVFPACFAIMIVSAAVITVIIYRNREKLYRHKSAAISSIQKVRPFEDKHADF